MTRIVRISLFTAYALATLAIAGCSERMGKGWDWNRMRMQPRYEPYRGSAFFADGKAMQLPPAGTISRESDVGALSATPLIVTSAALERGATQYHIYCAVCHGERGDGESIVARNMDDPKPPSLVTAPASLMPTSVVAAIISNGIGPMPSFSSDLSPIDREAVAAYVKTLQSAPTLKQPDSLTRNVRSQR
jgi:mono/diheme cytochrome c family protein